jgi:hypothetical protein
MRMQIAMITLVALAGCKTASDVRVRSLVERSETSRTVPDVAGCIALAATGRSIEIGSEELPRGKSISISMRVAGIKSVLSVYDIEDIGPMRRVSLYSVGGNAAVPRSISGKALACL